jgi:hypothetical protein
MNVLITAGQIPDRFIEMLNRDPLAYWAIRDGSDWPWPPYAEFWSKGDADKWLERFRW